MDFTLLSFTELLQDLCSINKEKLLVPYTHEGQLSCIEGGLWRFFCLIGCHRNSLKGSVVEGSAWDTSHNPYTVTSWARRTHLSPLRGRGYFANAHGCSDSDYIHWLSWAPEWLELTCCSGTNSTICCLHAAALNNIWQWQQLPLRVQWREHQEPALPLISAVKPTGSCPEEHDCLLEHNGGYISVEKDMTSLIPQKMEDTNNDYVFSWWN